MSDATTTLRALAAACEECLQAARNIPDNTACVHAQRIALMDALPDVTGWEQTAAALRAMADTVEALEAERDEARAVIALIAEACATPGCEDLASALTPSDYGALVEHVAVIASACDALRAEVARLHPLRALLEHCEAKDAVVSLSCVPDARLRWLLATGGDGISFRAHGTLDAVITAACDRLEVPHG